MDRRTLSPLLAFLLILAATAPLAEAQGNASASIVLSTSASAYPPGGNVLFSLQNQGTSAVTIQSAKLEVYQSAQLRTTIPVVNATTTLGASGSLPFSWAAYLDGAAAPTGSYFGILKLIETRTLPDGNTYPWETWVYVNGKSPGSSQAGWLLQQAQTLPGRLALSAGSASFRAGSNINFTLQNVGGANLTDPTGCGGAVEVRLKATNGVVWNSAASGVCTASLQVLEPGKVRVVAWAQVDGRGSPVQAGEYLARAAWGNATSADIAFTIVASAVTPAPSPEVRSIALSGPKDPVPPGVHAEFVLTNTGNVALDGTLGMSIVDSNGAVVHSPFTVQVITTLQAGASLRYPWDQRADDGTAAPGGTYHATASFAGLKASADVTLTGTLTPAPRPEPSPPAPAAPREPPATTEPPKPVVGRISVNASASATGCSKGDWVSFCVDAGARRLTDFSAAGRLVLSSMDIPGTGPIAVKAQPGALRVETDGFVIVLYDSPAGTLRVEAPSGPASVRLQLAGAMQASVTEDGAALRAPGFEALLLLTADGTVSASEGQVTMHLEPGRDAPAGFVLRAVPPQPAPSPEPAPGPVIAARASLAAELPKAIAEQKVAAETYIALEGGAVKTSVVPYISAAVNVTVAEATADALELSVDVSDHRGRTLVFHLGEGVLTARGGFRVLYDGAPIELATDLADVLDPDDDGLAAEYVIVEGSAGLEVIVSVPHFSIHTLRVEGLGAQVVQALGAYGALAALGVIAAAAVYMMRRGRDE